MMSFCRFTILPKFLLYAAIVYVCTSLIVTFLSNEPSIETPPQYSFPEIPTLWQDFCQFLEYSVEGVEGDFDNKTYRLRGLGIVFRHGERSPIAIHDELTVCKPYREIDRQLFNQYAQTIQSDDMSLFLTSDKKFIDFPKVPDGSECRAGELTAEGALQHVRLGQYMNSKYGSSSLFDTDYHLNVSITSSQYHRTYQSALAFTSSFLYPQRYLIPSLFIKASNFSYLCTHEACSCSIARSLRKRYEKECTDVFKSNAPSYMQDTALRLRKLQSFKHVIDPFEILDVSLGRYICRRHPLPCFNDDTCLTYEFLSEILNYATSRSSFVFSESDKYIAKRLQLVESHGVLFHLRDLILRLKQFPHTNMIKIFSGHDVTVGPLLRVLGVPFTDPPHYASRIAFELLEHNQTKKLFLRLIYNGEDVTKHIYICKNLYNGLCPIGFIEEFIKTELPHLLKEKSVTEFCKKFIDE